MATVYMARDLKHDRPVAIKVMRPELAATIAGDRFQQEIRVTANLEHPHILGMIDSGKANGLLYVVLPYLEGEDLQERLEREGPLPVDEALRIAKEVADALDYAHSRGVIHRDIKPSNIMLSGGHARVTDFGVARAVGEAGGAKLTATGQIIGTPFYMSPEQVTGEWELDGRIDIYALGCVLYAMLTGKPPYEGTTPPEVLAGHLHRPPPSVRDTQPEVTPALDTVIQRAMAKEPGERFDTAGDFLKALESPETAPPASVPSTARISRPRASGKPSGRRAMSALIGLAVLALVVWGITSVMGGQTMESLAVLPLTDLTDNPEQEYVSAGVHEALIGELGQLGLSVTARATMARYRDTDKGIGEIAQELGVDGVIEGSLYRAGDSLEIAARLYDRDEQQVWTASFDGVMPNVVALYRGFARAIADQIRLSLSPEDEIRLEGQAPVNPDVYEAYLRGMHVLHNATSEEQYDSAIAYFNQAV
ncbi:MAG: protein kinase, partial [Gemmatimonadetes bacterium]|nr:protein kinase [Gemmatimonadota bacterium]NIY10790.1 protein kinase [Gemmatimonadota bacterium]